MSDVSDKIMDEENPVEEEEDDEEIAESESQISDQQEKIQTENQGRKVTVQMNKQDPSCATYSFIEEDHTLGNSLRYLLMANTNTSFCGYTIPHPSESVMNLRLQTNGAKANDVIKGSLKDLATLCDILSENYERALEEFKQKSKK
eukprot:TRINITY_DN2496_c0_g1_i3.p1 TRINITY_DN2496_c0_g1~~TRINITY_DN2496_c0_g1_i3.p1  ORF type:complete len:146 (+),score=53.69 TRINITY_DN2496_c0_g1_i3:128-565(+)